MAVKTVSEAKIHAKALRAALALEGKPISHAQALELIARQNGMRDWNTLSALLCDTETPPFHVQQRVQGEYLGQPFTGMLTSLSLLGPNFAVRIRLDEPVDTVTFPGFSNLRRMIRGTVDSKGNSLQRTSNGAFHLILRRMDNLRGI